MPPVPTPGPRKLLKSGSHDPEVKTLQALLTAAGYPVRASGLFDPDTQAAVLAFQRAARLMPDAVVGNRTWEALEAAAAKAGSAPAGAGNPVYDCGTFRISLSTARRMCPGAPERNLRAHLPIVLQALADRGLGDETFVLMAIATIRAETGSFAPISEGVSKLNTTSGGQPFDKYDDRAKLGNRGSPDGASFKGRGFVQLTGRANYTKYGKAIGVDLVADPERANEPQIAARLLAEFLKANEAAIRQAMDRDDLAAARKLVNGGSNGLADFTAAIAAAREVIAGPRRVA